MNEQDYLRAAARLETAEGLDPWTALMRVLVARLRDVDLPVPMQQVLAKAARHWAGFPTDLLERNSEVWQYVRAAHPAGDGLVTPGGRAARALLCVLMPAGDEEARSMTAEWFTAMVDRGQHEA